MAARYQWCAPKAAKGDTVTFVDQYGHAGVGQVVKVITSYKAEGRAGVQRAQHTYAIHRGGRRRRVNVSERELLQVLPAVPSPWTGTARWPVPTFSRAELDA